MKTEFLKLTPEQALGGIQQLAELVRSKRPEKSPVIVATALKALIEGRKYGTTIEIRSSGILFNLGAAVVTLPLGEELVATDLSPLKWILAFARGRI